MSVFSFHLAHTTASTTLDALAFPPRASNVRGLLRAECMVGMTLGSSIVSSSRVLPGQLAVFAKWEDSVAIDAFLAGTKLGRAISTGWHVRLMFQRRWGYVSEFDGLPETTGDHDQRAPVVVVTLARMKLLQVPRFIRWGKPVEMFVRDHPGIRLAAAALRPPRTISTFTVWDSQRNMLDMVHGNSIDLKPNLHAAAMKERQRKDFHHQFTTLRFSPLSEHGEWEGRTNFVPAITPCP